MREMKRDPVCARKHRGNRGGTDDDNERGRKGRDSGKWRRGARGEYSIVKSGKEQKNVSLGYGAFLWRQEGR